MSTQEITLNGPGLALGFRYEDERLTLRELRRQDGPDLLCPEGSGGPLTVVVLGGTHAGVYGPDTFRVLDLTYDERSLRAYLAHLTLPLALGLEVSVEGHVATFRGQAAWNGEEPLDAQFYFPLLSHVRVGDPGRSRAIVPEVSGAVLAPLSEVEFRRDHLGGLASPTFLLDGEGRGLALLDDNRAHEAADAGAGVRRTVVIGQGGPQAEGECGSSSSGAQGTYAAFCHGRFFRPVGVLGLADADIAPEYRHEPHPQFDDRGDTVDLGPVRVLAYEGDWRVGAAWLREQRRHVLFRTSPAIWFRQTTFISEDMGDRMVRAGQTFDDYPALLAEKRRLGSDLVMLPGFHDPEVIGQSRNWLNRGDYFFAAQNLGGFEAARRGIEAVHRAGGHVLYYVEALIVWKRSRIGRARGRDWALMREDGSPDEHYHGFWHICPSVAEWRDWLASTCADIVRSTGVDGFFLDSACATHHHRCFNPAHGHSHPDTWTWGLRQMLRRVREEVDKVNPETVLFVEGAGDVAREFADGFITHSHDWTGGKFDLPLIRFLHPEMRAFESWGGSAADPEKLGRTPEGQHVSNAVSGHRIFAHEPFKDRMGALSARTRPYYDAYPEICDAPLSVEAVRVAGCLAELFASSPAVVTVGNSSGGAAEASLVLPGTAGLLYDRVDGSRVPLRRGEARLTLGPWEFRAYEVRA